MIGKLKQQFDSLKRDGSDDQPCTCEVCTNQLECDHPEEKQYLSEGPNGVGVECECGALVGWVHEDDPVPVEA